MEVVYIDDVYEDLTQGKYYTVIDKVFMNKPPWTREYLLKNDNGEEDWYVITSGIINFAESYNTWVKYIGESYRGLTVGKIYQLCGSEDEGYYYFMNDENKFVGIRKTNYLGGAKLFNKIDREEKLKQLGI